MKIPFLRDASGSGVGVAVGVGDGAGVGVGIFIPWAEAEQRKMVAKRKKTNVITAKFFTIVDPPQSS